MAWLVTYFKQTVPTIWGNWRLKILYGNLMIQNLVRCYPGDDVWHQGHPFASWYWREISCISWSGSPRILLTIACPDYATIFFGESAASNYVSDFFFGQIKKWQRHLIRIYKGLSQTKKTCKDCKASTATGPKKNPPKPPDTKVNWASFRHLMTGICICTTEVQNM